MRSDKAKIGKEISHRCLQIEPENQKRYEEAIKIIKISRIHLWQSVANNFQKQICPVAYFNF